MLCECLKRGQKIILVGLGKSLKIAEKCAASLQSMGLASITMHPTDALHGDMGSIQRGDCILACSTSGETQEIIDLLRYLDDKDLWTRDNGQPIQRIAVCRDPNSTLSRIADECLLVPQKLKECEIQDGLPAPTVSSTSMLIVLDCLALALSHAFHNSDLEARNRVFDTMHPGGSIGKKNAPNSDLRSSSVERGKIRPGMDELQILQAATLHDWLEWDAALTVPSTLIRSLYRQWAADQPRSTLHHFLAQKLHQP